MPTGIPQFTAALVPMQLDAFRLNPAVCGTGKDGDTTARISPITQPNYTFLRLENFLLQSDVQNHADLHNTAPASVNPRMSDIGARPNPQPLRHRHGIYIHWTLPRFYRSGSHGDDGSPDTPALVQPPTRWIVVRQLDLDSVKPAEAKPAFLNREYEAWVVESDHLWSLDQIPTSADLQTDLAPFVVGHAGPDVNIDNQAEVFIGRKTRLQDWSGHENPNAHPPNISLLRSGNQLFADFQMHNANVFSVLDNFEYGPDKKRQYLSHAKANYFVLGWHWKEDLDPLWNSGKTDAHAKSLETLFMKLQGIKAAPPEDRDPWLDDKSQLRILCHGAMYDVVWDHESKPKDVPADRFNARMIDPNAAAVSMGTTPMDALLSYCHSRTDHPDGPGEIAKLEADILLLESLLHTRDDGVEAQREAKDSVYNWSFNRAPGGERYYFSGEGNDGSSDKPPLEPEAPAILKLGELNQVNMLLDSCKRALSQYRWDMFSLWWKYVSDVGNKNVDPTNPKNNEFARRTKDLSQHITGLTNRMEQLQTQIDNLLDPKDPKDNILQTAKAASMPVFHRANDPTMLIGGVESGWPIDYLDKVSIRAPFQTISLKPGSPPLPTSLKKFLMLLEKVPDVFKEPARALVTEFYVIRPGGGDPGKADEGKYYPQFHDQLNAAGPRLSESTRVRYGISVPPTSPGQAPPPLWEAIPQEKPDVRTLSGRVLILPQPSFSLEAKVIQLFDNTPKDILEKYLSEEQQTNLRNNIKKLAYLSSPLSGFVDALITQAQGSHIKPENKDIGPDGKLALTVIERATNDDAGLTNENLGLIQGNSALTPYAALANFLTDNFCPFKPATHGQFRFVKLNIIDKFGQALMAIDQKPRHGGTPAYLPCISDFYEPQSIKLADGKTYANTVVKPKDDKTCQFIQLPPQINQNSRLNAHFVKRTAEDPGPHNPDLTSNWRPATEWESPIWGWVITNYADYGLQLFLPDGTFYREVRFGGPLGTLASPKWLPFAPPKTGGSTPDTRQLDLLLAELAKPTYLRGFWHMITTAQDKLPAAPSAYAQFLNSIVGKPLALVNMGWSLELDGPPFSLQSTKATVQDPERWLTEKSTDDPEDKRKVYEFQVRLGDADAAYDGLVGYFDTKAPGSDALDLGHVRTFFAPQKETLEPLKRLDTDTYPVFTPFWEAPFPTESPYDDPTRVVSPERFVDRRNARMSVFGAIVDPFTPVHAYSSILPPVALTLPPWTWQKAMNTMTAFFHAGPLTLPLNDVPGFDKDHVLTKDTARDRPDRDLPLPSLGAGAWSWFQPYAESAAPATPGGDSAPQPVFNAFGIEKMGDLNKPGFQKGPYTVIEGYFQLRNPIGGPAPQK
ncbi:hypothetical protein PG995_004104 [Apiospora arundinis]